LVVPAVSVLSVLTEDVLSVLTEDVLSDHIELASMLMCIETVITLALATVLISTVAAALQFVWSKWLPSASARSLPDLNLRWMFDVLFEHCVCNHCLNSCLN
jgi:hypothetical protein